MASLADMAGRGEAEAPHARATAAQLQDSLKVGQRSPKHTCRSRLKLNRQSETLDVRSHTHRTFFQIKVTIRKFLNASHVTSMF